MRRGTKNGIIIIINQMTGQRLKTTRDTITTLNYIGRSDKAGTDRHFNTANGLDKLQ